MTAKIIGKILANLIFYTPLFLMFLFGLRVAGMITICVLAVLNIITAIRELRAKQQVEDDIARGQREDALSGGFNDPNDYIAEPILFNKGNIGPVTEYEHGLE